ncbi:MAG TPA: hypothetical protein VFH75_07980, partial [Actinomycetota bacterium]|nr:hypothetical protein [Actinomycetota bacterium]
SRTVPPICRNCFGFIPHLPSNRTVRIIVTLGNPSKLSDPAQPQKVTEADQPPECRVVRNVGIAPM